jgi:hypothetical protein
MNTRWKAIQRCRSVILLRNSKMSTDLELNTIPANSIDINDEELYDLLPPQRREYIPYEELNVIIRNLKG